MTLAPIRGAPPGAFNPGFPTGEPRPQTAQPSAAPGSSDQPRMPPPVRQRQTPIVIGGSGIILTFRVIPEIPAISRPSMTVHVAADPAGGCTSHADGFLRMSAAQARSFLTELRNGRTPIAATGDEAGTVQLEFEGTEAGPVVLVRTLDQRGALQRCVVTRHFDLITIAAELLADLGA